MRANPGPASDSRMAHRGRPLAPRSAGQEPSEASPRFHLRDWASTSPTGYPSSPASSPLPQRISWDRRCAAEALIAGAMHDGGTNGAAGVQRTGNGNAVEVTDAYHPRCVGCRRCAWLARRVLRERPTLRGMFREPTQVDRCLRLLVAGPSSTVPSAANREPCNGQSQDFSRSLKRTTPPRCVQIAETAQVRPLTVEIATGSPKPSE